MLSSKAARGLLHDDGGARFRRGGGSEDTSHSFPVTDAGRSYGYGGSGGVGRWTFALTATSGGPPRGGYITRHLIASLSFSLGFAFLRLHFTVEGIKVSEREVSHGLTIVFNRAPVVNGPPPEFPGSPVKVCQANKEVMLTCRVDRADAHEVCKLNGELFLGGILAQGPGKGGEVT